VYVSVLRVFIAYASLKIFNFPWTWVSWRPFCVKVVLEPSKVYSVFINIFQISMETNLVTGMSKLNILFIEIQTFLLNKI
jgi:hypothetical protein